MGRFRCCEGGPPRIFPRLFFCLSNSGRSTAPRLARADEGSLSRSFLSASKSRRGGGRRKQQIYHLRPANTRAPLRLRPGRYRSRPGSKHSVHLKGVKSVHVAQATGSGDESSSDNHVPFPCFLVRCSPAFSLALDLPMQSAFFHVETVERSVSPSGPA